MITTKAKAMTDALKPCPFCGDTPIYEYHEGREGLADQAMLECRNRLCCVRPKTDALTYDGTGKQRAARFWNTRVTPPSQTAEGSQRLIPTDTVPMAETQTALRKLLREAHERASAEKAHADMLAEALKNIASQDPQKSNSEDENHENYLRKVIISLAQQALAAHAKRREG